MADLDRLIQCNVPLRDKNWFKTGGTAAYYAEPTTAEEFSAALAWAQQQHQPITLLGAGANILIADAGIKGLVIRPVNNNIDLVAQQDETALVRVGAGCSMDDLIEWCLSHELLGLEEFSGIPGTVGGSIYIN